VNNAIGYAEHYSRSHDAVIRVYDDAGNVIEMHEHKGDFKRVVSHIRRAAGESVSPLRASGVQRIASLLFATW
jgi:hypothetical protein